VNVGGITIISEATTKVADIMTSSTGENGQLEQEVAALKKKSEGK
jgi:hypothetical protein